MYSWLGPALTFCTPSTHPHTHTLGRNLRTEIRANPEQNHGLLSVAERHLLQLGRQDFGRVRRNCCRAIASHDQAVREALPSHLGANRIFVFMAPNAVEVVVHEIVLQEVGFSVRPFSIWEYLQSAWQHVDIFVASLYQHGGGWGGLALVTVVHDDHVFWMVSLKR